MSSGCDSLSQSGGDEPVEDEPKRGAALVIRLLRCSGLWPMKGDSKLYLACTVLLSVNVYTTAGLFASVYFVGGQDSFALIENTAHILITLPSLVNVASMVVRRREYESVISSIQEIVSYKDSDPEDDVKGFVRGILSRENKVVMGFVWVTAFSTVFLLLKPITQIVLRILLEGGDDVTPHSLKQPLLLLPMLEATSWRSFFLQYLFQIATVAMLYPGIVFTDLFHYILIKYAAHQFEVLSIVLGNFGHKVLGSIETDASPTFRVKAKETGNLLNRTQLPGKVRRSLEGKTYIHNTSGANSPRCLHEGRQKNLEEILNEIVSKHQGILRNVDNLSKLLSRMLLSHYLVSSLCLCLTLFNAKSDSSQLIVGGTLMLTLMSRLLAVSYYSSELIHQSLEVSEAAYRSNWPGAGAAIRRSLVVVMCRSQRPVVMRAGFFAVMSLQTFLAVIQCAYSYYNVLTNLNSP